LFIIYCVHVDYLKAINDLTEMTSSCHIKFMILYLCQMERKGTEELSKLCYEEIADSYFAPGV